MFSCLCFLFLVMICDWHSMLEDIIRAIQSTHVDMMLSVVQTISSITQQLRPYAEDVLMRDLHAILQTLLSVCFFFRGNPLFFIVYSRALVFPGLFCVCVCWRDPECSFLVLAG